MSISIRNYEPEDIEQLIVVQKSYQEKYPDYIIRDGSVYTDHPVFEQGKNILCAVNAKGNIIAYGPLVPAPVLEDSPVENEHYIWTDIIYDPQAEWLELAQTMLLERILLRAKEIKAGWCSRKCRLAVVKFSNEIEGLDFFRNTGFVSFEELHMMVRDLSKPISKQALSDDWTLNAYTLDGEEEKKQYVQADNLSNLNSPISMDKLNWFVENSLSRGTVIGAFDEKKNLLGSVMAYGYNSEHSVTEEIFVIPSARRRGIAQALVGEALNFLKEKGYRYAELEVRKSNVPAVALYEKMGYQISKTEYSLGKYLE